MKKHTASPYPSFPAIRRSRFAANLFVPNIPVCSGKTSGGWRRTSTTGISPLRGSLRAAPTCCDGSRRPFAVSTLDFMAGQEYRPIAGHRRAGSRPALRAVRFSLRTGQRQTQDLSLNRWRPAVSRPAHPGAEAHAAYAHHNSNGNVPDEWLFSCQGTDPAPLGSREQAGSINPFTYYLT